MYDIIISSPHHGGPRFRMLILLLLGIVSLLPEAAQAQSDSGWLVKPSLLAAQAYDDNVFFTPDDPVDDSVLRLSPALEAGYRSVPTAFNAYYTQDAQRYDEHPELDSNRARQHGELNFSHEATSRLTLLADTSHTRTQIPGELDPHGLELGRAQSERFYFSPAAMYQFDRTNIGTASYAFNREEVAGGIGSDTQVLALDLDHLLSRRDTLHFAYRFEQFEFEDAGFEDGEFEDDESIDMHVLLLGATRQFTPQTSFTLMAGPRFSAEEEEDKIDPEIMAALLHDFSRGDFELRYTQSQTTVLGLAGTADTQSFGASFVYPLGSSMGVRAETIFITSDLGGLEADSLVTDVEIGYRLGDYFTLIGAYEANSQRGSLETPGLPEINRNFVWLGLVIAPPVRTDSAWWRRERATSTVLEEPTLRRRE